MRHKCYLAYLIFVSDAINSSAPHDMTIHPAPLAPAPLAVQIIAMLRTCHSVLLCAPRSLFRAHQAIGHACQPHPQYSSCTVMATEDAPSVLQQQLQQPSAGPKTELYKYSASSYTTKSNEGTSASLRTLVPKGVCPDFE